MSGPVRLGVLGCADIAARRVLPAVLAEPSLRLVAVASRSRAKAQAYANRFGCAAIEGYQELLDRDSIDAVYVPLPAGLHAEWIERALRAGKHVLAEKPMTTSPESTRTVLDLAAAQGLTLLENYLFPHHRQHAEVARLLAEGEIGELRGLTASFTVPPRPPGDIRLDPGLGGGALLDTGGYPVRAAQLLIGTDLRLAGAVLRRAQVDLGGSMLLARPDGVTARLAFGIDDGYTCEYELFGSRGRMLLPRAFTPPPDLRAVLRIERDGDVVEKTLPADDQCANMLRAFVASVRREPGAPSAKVAAEISLKLAELLAAGGRTAGEF